MRRLLRLAAGLAFAAVLAGRPALAEVTVGAILSLTGPAAPLGIPARNVIALLPREIAGETIRYVVIDDGTDGAKAVRAFNKLVTDERVDLVLGPSSTPTSLAVLDAAGNSGTPFISLGGSDAIILPQESHRRWAFKLAAPEAAQLGPALDHLKAKGGRSIAAIAQSTAFGDAFVAVLREEADRRGLRYLGAEKYGLTDPSVTPQVLKLLSLKPDAMFIAASGTPGALPVVELRNRVYTGLIIHNQGIANPDFLRAAGKSAEGMILAASPVIVAEQLPAEHLLKQSAMDYVKLYETRYGPNTRSLTGATMWDAHLLLARALPKALATTRPGTPRFRTALRDAIERDQGVPGAAGLYALSPANHNGTDARSLVLITVKDGQWQLLR